MKTNFLALSLLAIVGYAEVEAANTRYYQSPNFLIEHSHLRTCALRTSGLELLAAQLEAGTQRLQQPAEEMETASKEANASRQDQSDSASLIIQSQLMETIRLLQAKANRSLFP